MKFLFVVSCTFLLSCNDDFQESVLTNNQDTESKETQSDLKKEFSLALVSVLKENSEVRSLIKKEALKKIDYDYDVLYALIKDESLSNGETVESVFTRYIDINRLKEIEQEYPTLTIFIPTLPENSFSAEIWDAENDIPAVSYISSTSVEGIPVIYSNGEEGVIEFDIIPTYPIVVVKENERIVKTSTNKSAKGSAVTLRSGQTTSIEFIDDVFNNQNKINDDSELRARPLDSKYNKLFSAFDVFGTSAGWQRDYIYYNLTPTVRERPYENAYMEQIVGFEMVGDGLGALRKISDQAGDPQAKDEIPNGGRDTHPRSIWTDGEFEFKVKIYLGTKSPIGTELITYFRAMPEQLFDLIYTRKNGAYYKLTKAEPLRLNLSLPLFDWNLENYSSTIKIAIEEVDATQTSIVTSSTTVEFAANFEYSVGFGEVVKKGLKFGASVKQTRTNSFQISTTYGNDELGEVIVNFEDPIIVSKNDVNTSMKICGPRDQNCIEGPIGPFIPDFNKKYATGWYRIYIAPVKIY